MFPESTSSVESPGLIAEACSAPASDQVALFDGRACSASLCDTSPCAPETVHFLDHHVFSGAITSRNIALCHMVVPDAAADMFAKGDYQACSVYLRNMDIKALANSRISWTLDLDGQKFICPSISPFWLACWSGNLQLVQELYQGNPDINEGPECENGADGRTPLMAAVQNGHADVVEALLNWGADTQRQDSCGLSVDILNIAFNRGSPSVKSRIEQLISARRTALGTPQFHQSAHIGYIV